MTDSKLTADAAQAGIDSFMTTFGRFPEQFQLLHQHAPGAFAGYGLMRSFVMQERPEGALDMKTKELIFALLDTLHGDSKGAINHGTAAIKLGLTAGELAEGLVQVIMVGGISTWNLVGQHVMRACTEAAAPQAMGNRGEGGRE
jgi:alkylhydroperoxidase/carboxymuconolactone decarboxylase family protein YurZ